MSAQTKGAALSAIDAHADDEVRTALAEAAAEHEAELQTLVAARDQAQANASIAVESLAALRADYDAHMATHAPVEPPVPPKPTQQPVIGINTQSTEPSYATTWPAARVYRLGHAATAAAKYGCQIVAVTDDPNLPRGGGAAAAAKLRSALEDFYYTGAGSEARKDVEYHFANGNEVDREYTSGTLPAAVVDTWRRMYDVIHETNAAGVRRYPKASMWVDLTTWQVKTAGAGARFKAIAPYLDGVAASLYPTGREVPVVFTPYADYIDPVLALAADWGVKDFACWEVGIPIDKAHSDGTPNNGGTTDWSIRPRYLAGGKDSTGKTWEGFLNYLTRRCTETGLRLQEVCYWNEQVNPDIPNPFKHDRGKTTPDTATAWRAWTPGSSLPSARA